ncbi:serpentine type 7TM GPCR chemoreceptor srd domain-containing protein [Ditylenchus destructor]|uniref:Serpentine type 7TM GPCR chemoreceptor srd domain-containing protein n=1 Tax=Ditylenchus destructor TaxID=166010 RepID=A0AAD4R232_9BILA|nr:serpentine type 7TM GPCR chemoreceptor srd domain-containing protein [Ditylenchus destructor]
MTLDRNQVHHITETFVNGLSILFNCSLLYLIKYHSTFGIKVYRLLLTVDALLDLCLGIVVLLGQPIGMTGGGITIIISNGFFSGRSATLDSILITTWSFILHTNVLWIPVQFVYRYRLLCKNEHSIKATCSIVAIATIYSAVALFVIVSFCEVREEFQSDGQLVINLNNWVQPDDTKIFFTGAPIRDWRMIAWLLLWTTTCAGSIVIVIWCEMKIMSNFNQFGKAISVATRRMHKEFNRALLAMAICPLVTTTGPVFYYIFAIAFQQCSGPTLSGTMSMAATCVTFFNPLTTILFLRCYRRVLFSMVACGKKNLW